MTEKEYREHPAISRSELWKISESPEKFRYYKDNPQPPTPALLFGQVLHKMVLQPDDFDSEFIVAPNIDRRTKAGKEEYADFLLRAEGKTIISADDFNKAAAMCASLRRAPFVDKLLSGECEKEFFWTDEMTGEECKCRVDCITPLDDNRVMVIDLKSASDASNDKFMRDSINYGYDFQTAMYSDGVAKNTGKEVVFVFIVVEKEPPYSVNIFQADELFTRRGYDIFRELIGVYHECKESGEWYGYLGKFNAINNLSLPAWLAKEVE